jgi:hypothetical protein
MLALMFLWHAVTAVATLRTRLENTESSHFGGVYITRKDNHQIDSIADFKDKVLELSSFLVMGAGLAQWLELRNRNFDIFNDPAQARRPTPALPLMAVPLIVLWANRSSSQGRIRLASWKTSSAVQQTSGELSPNTKHCRTHRHPARPRPLYATRRA